MLASIGRQSWESLDSVLKYQIDLARLKTGMSPLLGGRQHCVIPYGISSRSGVATLRTELLYGTLVTFLYFTHFGGASVRRGGQMSYILRLLILRR